MTVQVNAHLQQNQCYILSPPTYGPNPMNLKLERSPLFQLARNEDKFAEVL